MTNVCWIKEGFTCQAVKLPKYFFTWSVLSQMFHSCATTISVTMSLCLSLAPWNTNTLTHKHIHILKSVSSLLPCICTFVSSPLPPHLDSHPLELDVCIDHSFLVFLMLWHFEALLTLKGLPLIPRDSKVLACKCIFHIQQSSPDPASFIWLLHSGPLLSCPNHPKDRYPGTR